MLVERPPELEGWKAWRCAGRTRGVWRAMFFPGGFSFSSFWVLRVEDNEVVSPLDCCMKCEVVALDVVTVYYYKRFSGLLPLGIAARVFLCKNKVVRHHGFNWQLKSLAFPTWFPCCLDDLGKARQ